MKYFTSLSFALICFSLLTGCYSYRYNAAISNPSISSKEAHGESSSIIVFRLFGGQSGSIQEAAENGSIETINRVEYEKSNVFGSLIQVYTTHVYGSQKENIPPIPVPTSSFTVMSNDSCRIYDNGKFIGYTNTDLKGLTHQLHKIEIRKEGASLSFDTITISENNRYVLRLNSEKLSALASYPGGLVEMNKYISNHAESIAQSYTPGTKKRINVAFVVTENGDIKDIEVIQSVEKSLVYEIIKIFQNMPKWTPATLNGKNVSSWVTIPINFGN